MDLYINTIPKFKFKLLNRFWGDLGFASPHIVGLLFAMIEAKAFPTWKKWEKSYLQSGKSRLVLLQKLSVEFKEKVQNPAYFKKSELKWPIYKINYFYGRTNNEILNISQSLYTRVSQENTGSAIISLAEALEFVRFKIIGEPWNQHLLRYTKTIKILQQQFPDIHFKRARIEFVDNYGFRGLVTKNGKPKAGIGVKSPGWLNQPNLLYRQWEESKEKIHCYKNTFGADVYSFFSNLDGSIVNIEEARRFQLNSIKYMHRINSLN